ncbi:uncharacterized protein LOC129951227 isoform X3 [Eupeodes corollae]|uniref:uncharacterized protein LOC129951227 isoform X3 n=1 Tax=Eupeodes corollae TaxID=290404 RepID=UPI0024917419|nr:uncharacterized protein LOC129951227 isoform X3 [Eupeodes corollae]
MMSSQAVYCLNLQIQSNCDENGKTVSTRTQNSNEVSKQNCSITMDSSSSDEPSPLQKAIVQHNSSQSIFDTGQSHQQSTGSTNNIILLRGSRNENGQIIIQNKHDVISFINEEDKPLILHTPRKTNGGGNSSTSTGGSGGGGGGNTILLQTPINANQLESVLLQSAASMKKGNLGERSFLIQKQPSRTYTTDGNRLTTTTTLSGANAKGPFILQTLKRLEKSQSILVIRNSSANTSHSNNNNISTTTSSDVTTAAGNVNTATSTPPLATSSSLPSSLAFSRVTTTPQSTQTGLVKQTSSVSVTTGAAVASIPTRVKSTNARLGIIQHQQQHANNNNAHNNKGNNTGNNYSRNPRNSLHGAGGVGSGVGTSSGGGGGAGTAVNLDEVQNKLEAAGQQKKTNVPLGSDGEPIKLPDNLESLPRADSFPSQRHRWNTNEEIAAILISFDKHSEWQSKEVKTRPKSGSLLLYSRKKVRYRRDGYCWKKRKDGKTTREDHMKLKVQGTECIYGCYVHSAILPTFHRRCYWLLQNPDIVLVHYLNVPYPDDNKMAVIAPSLTLWGDKKEWTKEELVSQLKPMLSTVFSDEDSDSGNDIEISNAETVESIVSQLMEKQRLARQAALVKQLECGCPDSTCADGKSCSHPMRRIGIMKTLSDKRNDAYNQVTSTTPNVLIGAKLYSRWPERKSRLEMVTAEAVEHHERQNGEIKFQVIPSHMEQQQQQQQHQQHQQFNITRHTQMFAGRNNLIATPTQGPTSGGGGGGVSGSNTSNVNAGNFNQQSFANASNQNNQMNLNRNNINHIIINQQQQQQQQSHLVGGVGNNIITTTKTVTTYSGSNTNSGAGSGTGTGSASATHNSSQNNNNNNNSTQQQQQLSVMSPQQISLQNSNERNELNNNNSINPSQGHLQHQQSSQHQLQHHHHQHHQQQQQQQSQKQQTNDLNMSLGGNPSSSSQTEHHSFKQQHQHQQQHHQQQQQHQHHHLLRASLASSTTPSITTISGVAAAAAVASTSTHSNKSQQHPNSHSHSHHQQQLDQQQSQQQQQQQLNTHPHSLHIHHPSQQQQQTLIECNDINQGQQQQSSNLISNTSDDNGNRMGSDTGTVVNVVGDVGSSAGGGGQGSQPMSTDLGGSMLNLSQDAEHLLDTELDVSETGFHGLQSSCGDSSANNVISANQSSPSSLQDKKEQSPSAASERTATSDVSDSLAFFNETLDLSQEDIQRTLIANMPFGGSSDVVVNNHHDDRVTSDLNPMDFIANVCDVTNNGNAKRSSRGGAGGVGGNGIHDDDENEDVFVNLDAFDMLVEFPELEFDGKHESESSLSFDSSLSRVFSNSNRRILTISDYSPEWAYPEGGVKVLVTGPWKLSSTYTVLFDSVPVPTILVQEGVLRCFCPAHEVGLATLQVASDGYVISNSVIFEYKSSPNPEATFDGTTNDCLYKFTLLNRLSSIDEKMQIKMEPKESPEDAAFMMQSNFEERMVNYCHQLTNKLWRSNAPVSWTSSGFKGMTLLHLAAALGYAKLVCAMLNWRTENPNFILETEIDALSQDVYGYTPMTWACARGHTETALILYKFNHNAMKIKNLSLQTPMDVAKSKGFKYLLSELSRLENEKNKNRNDLSISYDLSKQLKQNSNDLVNGQTIKDEITGSNNSDNSSDSQNTDASDINRSHDGVFLRPIAVASNQSPPTNSRYSKRSSIDSGINMDMRSFNKCGKPFKDQNKLTSFDCNDNYSLSVDSTFDGFSALTSSSSLLSPLRKMDFALWESDAKVLTLAEHIIAAMPERIKNESDEMMILGSPMSESLHGDNSGISNMQDSFMDPLLDSLPNTHFDNDFNFDFSDHNYRYHDVSTPCSSLSPASSGPLQSPASYSIPPDPPMNSPSPPPSTKQLTEFLQASNNAQRPFEADFSKLTLTDSEQRELYEAAKCIQKAYRSYKGRQKMEEQNKERSAAIVIQNYYRRYKQYAYFRQMTNAALVIQHGYRSYCKNKRFKKSPHSSSLSSGNNLHSSYSESSSQCLSSYFYQQQDISQPTTPKETSPSGPLKRTYSQSTQNQAARKIQQFMRQSKLNIWDGNVSLLTSERTSRKREAGAPTQGGIPPKLAVSRATGNCAQSRTK